MTDFETAFKKPFTDIQKLIIGILLSIVPIVNWFARGFAMECSGVGKYKKSKTMPEWKDLGDFFIKGLFSFIIGLLYALPALVILLIGAGSMLGSLITMAFRNMMPFAFHSGDKIFIQGVMANNISELIPALIRFAPFLLLSLLLGLLAAYLIPMATIMYLKKKNLGEALKFKEVFKKAFTQDYFVAWSVVGLVGAVGLFALGWIRIIGGAAVSFIVSVIGYTLFGEAYSKT